QPQPESYFVSDSNSSAPHPAQWYVPGSKTWSYSPVNGASVPFPRRTRYCSASSSARHCSSVFSIFGMPSLYGADVVLEPSQCLLESDELRVVESRRAPLVERDPRFADSREESLAPVGRVDRNSAAVPRAPVASHVAALLERRSMHR